MTATTAKAAQTAKAPVQIGKPKEEANTNGFANLLADTISKGSQGTTAKVAAPTLDVATALETKHTAKPVLKEHAKGKGPLGDLDLSTLGEVDPESVDGKKGAIKLGDLLAELSHKSEAPTGSEVINLKTVLSSKNDDPDLINKDLLGLVIPKDRHKVMQSLINGAKQLLTDQLESRIPKDRVPKTLKGLLETAIRFNMVVSDIKLETLPESKVTKDLLAALNVKAKQENPLPALNAKVAVGESDLLGSKNISTDKKELSGKAESKKSPLEQILKSQEKAKSATATQATVKADASSQAEMVAKEAELIKEQPLTKAMETAAAPVKTVAPQSREKEKDKTKVEAKDTSKVASKEGLTAQGLRNDATLNKVETLQNQAQKSGSLEKLLAVDTQEESLSENKAAQESGTHQNSNSAVASKQETSGLKPDNGLGVKMAEARQLVSQLSSDIKEAMQNYKPPFTKLSMKLNPERLGEIDVMMVQRGNNVHINLTSNGAALGMLQQNSADLKNALADAGLGDATMNFSSNGESRNQTPEQQQQHSTSERYAEMSKILEDIDTLELVVPRYV